MNWYETTVSLYIAIYCLCQTPYKSHNLKLASALIPVLPPLETSPAFASAHPLPSALNFLIDDKSAADHPAPTRV
jgi:hypothetical protein